MTIAICDDEKDVRELLKHKVRTICPDAELVLYQTGKELLAARDQIDILFFGYSAARERWDGDGEGIQGKISYDHPYFCDSTGGICF